MNSFNSNLDQVRKFCETEINRKNYSELQRKERWITQKKDNKRQMGYEEEQDKWLRRSDSEQEKKQYLNI